MSKRTQTPSAKSAARQAASEGPQEYRKPRADVYTVLLVIALLFLIITTVALWMTIKEYNNEIKGGPTPVWHQPAAGTLFDAPRGIA
jgi:hypothetical protein